MKSEILKDITDYIDFLREQGFSVMVSCFDKVFDAYLPTLLEYEVHLCEICSYLKAEKKTAGKCPKNKRKLQNKEITKPYYSCCFAGVEEFVVPVKAENKTIICINISGYRGKCKQSQFLASKLAKGLGSEFLYLYSSLKTDVPTEKTVNAITAPLKFMFLALYNEALENSDNIDNSNKLYNEVLQFIYDNYMTDCTAKTIAKKINYSESYIRHIFAEKSGSTIAQTVNKIRLNRAKTLLLNTNASITQIALQCGFCDGNYFSVVFKKEFNCSPKEYKRTNL